MIISPSHRVSTVQPYYFATKLAEIAQRNAAGADIINLGIGSPDLLPPEAVIAELTYASKDAKANKYQSYKGSPELRQAFADHYHQHFNVTIEPHQEVLPLIGTKEGIMHISMAFLNDGDQVLIPNPGYPTYTSATKLAGGVPLYYDLTLENNWLPDLSNLEQKDLSKVKIMWINYPHMPTGAKIDLAGLQELVDFAKRHEILLCHDNPYVYILNDTPLSIFNCKGSKNHCIELFSLSKCYNMAGWRVGAMIGGSNYIQSALTFKSNMDSGMYLPVQRAATVALRTPTSWLNEQNKVYQERKQIAFQILDTLDCTYKKDQAGMFVWANVPGDITNVEAWIDEIIAEAEVFLTPGFIFGSNGDRSIRISLCANQTLLTEALRRIRDAKFPN